MLVLKKNVPKTRIMKKNLLVLILFGLFPLLSTRQTYFISKNKYEDKKLLLREYNKKYWLQLEDSSYKYNETQKEGSHLLLPIPTASKHSSRHRKGKIVYTQK